MLLLPASLEAARCSPPAGAPLLTTPPKSSKATRQVDDITTTNFVRLFIIFMTRPGAKTVRSQVRCLNYMTNRELRLTEQEDSGLGQQIRENRDAARTRQKITAFDGEMVIAAQILKVIDAEEVDIR